MALKLRKPKPKRSPGKNAKRTANGQGVPAEKSLMEFEPFKLSQRERDMLEMWAAIRLMPDELFSMFGIPAELIGGPQSPTIDERTEHD